MSAMASANAAAADACPLPATPRVERALRRDAPTIAALLRDSAPETIPVPVESVAREIGRFRVIREGGQAVATAALQPVGDTRFELRAVSVSKSCGGRGLGTRIVRAMQAEARRLGRRLVCMTMSPGFFEKLGFERVPLEAVPPKAARRDIPANRERVAMSWQPDPNGASNEGSLHGGEHVPHSA